MAQPTTDLLTTEQIGVLLAELEGRPEPYPADTIRHYIHRRGFPPPRRSIGRSGLWASSDIAAWHARRPGRGAGGGRPRKTAARLPISR